VFKKLGLSLALAFALVGGGIAASTAPVAVTTPAAVAQAAPVVQVASLGQASAGVQVASLTVGEMSAVQGSAFFSWKKFKKWLKKVIKKVIGVIIAEIVEVIRDWLEEIFGVAEADAGGEKLETTDVQTKEYASEADYNADNAYSDQTQYNPWQQTEVWYGGGGGGSCGGGGGDQQVRMYEQDMQTC
jgi:hypothetical protein